MQVTPLEDNLGQFDIGFAFRRGFTDGHPGLIAAVSEQLVVLSEEGGRFHHARNRYLVVEAPDGVDATAESASFRWVTLRQLAGLLPHSHYLNVQARSLVACLHSLASTTAGAWAT